MRFLRSILEPVRASSRNRSRVRSRARSRTRSRTQNPGPEIHEILRYIPVKRPYESLILVQTSNNVSSEVWLGTRYSTLPVPTAPHHPGYTPSPPRCPHPRWPAARWTKTGRGALIGRPTHFGATLVAVLRYDRGL